MSKRDKFLESCRKQKLDTVRWSLGAGGQSPTTRDEDGYTAIMICAAGNLHKALRMLVDHCRKTREREQMDLADGAGDGRTALMMAANNGHKEACQELLDAGCNFKLKCERGMTAADYAAKKGFHELAARINRGGESSEEDTDDEDDAYDSDAPEGETATSDQAQKRELEAKERRGATDTAAAAAAAAPPPRSRRSRRRRRRRFPPRTRLVRDREGHRRRSQGARSRGAPPPVPDGAEVDPALWWAASVNNLKLAMGPALTRLPDDVSRLAGLKTLIISNNALTALPTAIGKLTQLKVLEAENNAISTLPDEIANCSALENLRLANNAVESVAPLAGCNTLVTLVIDGNKGLTSLDELDLASKERLVTLSAKRCSVEAVPEDIGKCGLLAEVFLTDNNIGDLPMAMGELKEKKVRALEFDGNPLNDPKIKKMIGKSSNLVKELLVYVRKNGAKPGGGGKGGKGGKKGKKKAKRESSSDEESDADEEPPAKPTPAPAPAAPAAPQPASKPAAGSDSDSDSEDEEELRERMSRMSKKERVKAERKLAERKAAKASKAAAKKRAEADAAAAVKRAAAVDYAALEDDDDEEIDSDDEEALLARKRRARAAASGGSAYTLTPEQRAAAEKEEAERLAAVQAKKDAEEAAARAALEAKEAEEAFAKMKLKEAAEGVVMTWVYEKGQIHRKPGGIPPKPGKRPGDHPTLQVAIPQMIVGRVIGKAGATIRSIEERSKARVSLQEGKGGPGMATLVVVGDDRAAESVRMMVNNAIGGKR